MANRSGPFSSGRLPGGGWFPSGARVRILKKAHASPVIILRSTPWVCVSPQARMGFGLNLAMGRHPSNPIDAIQPEVLEFLAGGGWGSVVFFFFFFFFFFFKVSGSPFVVLPKRQPRW